MEEGKGQVSDSRCFESGREALEPGCWMLQGEASENDKQRDGRRKGPEIAAALAKAAENERCNSSVRQDE